MRLRKDLVLVKLAPPPERSHGGLLLAESLPVPVCLGKVVQTGPDVSDVRAGDVVTFPPEVGEDVSSFFAVPHLLLSEQQVTAVVERT